MIVDHLDDTNYTGWHQIANSCELPEFVKEAHITTREDVAALPLKCFADPRNRSFPINTKEDAWFSCAYFEKFAAETDYSEQKYTKIKANLEKAAALWGITWPTFMQEKVAAAPISIVYVSNGQPYHSTGVYDFSGLEKLANDLISNRGRYPWDMRRDTAKQILATEHLFEDSFNDNTARSLEKIAAQAVGLLKEAKEQVMIRRQTYREHPEVQEKLAAFADSLDDKAKNGFISPETANNVIGLLDSLDRMSDDNNKYASEGTAPEDIIFGVTLKDMQRINNHMVKLANGEAISTSQAGTQKTAHFIKMFTGVEVKSQQEAIEAVKNLDPNTAGILARAL